MFVDRLGFWLRGLVHVRVFHHSDHRRAAVDEWEVKGHPIETTVKSGTTTLTRFEALQPPLRINVTCMPSPWPSMGLHVPICCSEPLQHIYYPPTSIFVNVNNAE